MAAPSLLHELNLQAEPKWTKTLVLKRVVLTSVPQQYTLATEPSRRETNAFLEQLDATTSNGRVDSICNCDSFLHFQLPTDHSQKKCKCACTIRARKMRS